MIQKKYNIEFYFTQKVQIEYLDEIPPPAPSYGSDFLEFLESDENIYKFVYSEKCLKEIQESEVYIFY